MGEEQVNGVPPQPGKGRIVLEFVGPTAGWVVEGQIHLPTAVNALQMLSSAFVAQQLAQQAAQEQQAARNRIQMPGGPVPPFRI